MSSAEPRAFRIVLIGPPGVGKGTQAELLAERLGLQHFSSGVIFRSEIEAETDLGRLAKRYIDEGRLVPNGITIEMMAKRLRKDEARRRGFILDGYPRTVRQADALAGDLRQMDLNLDAAVNLVAPQEVVVQRLSGRGRSDDSEDIVRKRMLVFYEETEPVIDYYRIRGLLREVDADQPIESVYSQIAAAIGAG
jgi:adenylate kinase